MIHAAPFGPIFPDLIDPPEGSQSHREAIEMAENEVSETATSADSADYRHSFYGILNAQGDFWTPLAFDSERSARRHIEAFWAHDTAKLNQCLRTHRIVPVRIRLEELSA